MLVQSDDLRVVMDIPYLLDLNPEVRTEIGVAAALADRLYPPWHWRGDVRVRHDSWDAVPHTMGDVLKKDSVQTILQQVLPNTPFAIPCYRLPDGAALVLDGTHRFLSLLNWCPTVIPSTPMKLFPQSSPIIWCRLELTNEVHSLRDRTGEYTAARA